MKSKPKRHFSFRLSETVSDRVVAFMCETGWGETRAVEFLVSQGLVALRQESGWEKSIAAARQLHAAQVLHFECEGVVL